MRCEERPDLLIHTGDLTHLSTPAEFDTVAEILKGAKVGHIAYVPGEHDVIGDSKYLERFGKGTKGDGWYSFDHRGVHFVGLVNVASQGTDKGLGILGDDQLRLAQGGPGVALAGARRSWSSPTSRSGRSTPSGAGARRTASQALGLLKRFGSVTVLNGHIHQVFQKVEGNVTFHTARSTAFPQPEPGKAAGPGPLKGVPADRVALHARPRRA